MIPPMTNNDSNVPATRLFFNPSTGKHERVAIEDKSKDKFIRGPIPYLWVQKANSLPGKAGAVGIALWFLVGIKNSTTFSITAQIEQLAGCARQTLYRALESLETAKLITLETRSGARHMVTILSTTKDKG